MTRGKIGHYCQRTIFQSTAVVLTSGSSYSIPDGAAHVKAWAVGNGTTSGGAGGTAFKTWEIEPGDSSISFSVGTASGASTTVAFKGTTITGSGGSSNEGGGYSGGDGGAEGGWGGSHDLSGATIFKNGGAVGGNGVYSNVPSAGWNSTILRMPAAEVSGLLAAVDLAGEKSVEDGGELPAFGSGCADFWISGDNENSISLSAGLGGGGAVKSGARGTIQPGGGAVVLRFD